MTLDLPPDWGERPAFLRALELLALHTRADRSTVPWLGLPILLKALGVTKAPLPCLVAADRALRLVPRDRDATTVRFLKALTTSAGAGLARLNGVEGKRVRAAQVIGRASRPGRLVDLAALLQRRPLLTPLGVSRTLGLSVSGAGKLLARAGADGLLVEISGRQAWRAYIAPDLAVAFGYATRPIGRPPSLPGPGSLDPVLARFDADMAAFDASLGVSATDAVDG